MKPYAHTMSISVSKISSVKPDSHTMSHDVYVCLEHIDGDRGRSLYLRLVLTEQTGIERL